MSENSTKSSSTGALILQTTIAIFLAIATYMVVATLAGMFIYFTQSLLTVIRPEILQFLAILTGSIAGIYCARQACDVALRDYSKKAVFGAFIVLTAVVAVAELYSPHDWDQFFRGVQIVTAAIGAYYLFWVGEPI